MRAVHESVLRAFRKWLPAHVPVRKSLWVDWPQSRTLNAGLIWVEGKVYSYEKAAPVLVATFSGQSHTVELIEQHTKEDGRRVYSFTVSVTACFFAEGGHTFSISLLSPNGRILETAVKRIEITHGSGPFRKMAAELRTKKIPAIRSHSFSAEQFPFSETKLRPWFDEPNALEMVSGKVATANLPSEFERHFEQFIREGYFVLENVIPAKTIAQINADADEHLQQKLATGWEGDRTEHLFAKSRACREAWTHPLVLKVLSALFEDEAMPCQTLNFHYGTEQGLHQDLIHFTTFPVSYMCGVWLALEDIDPLAGPLMYAPGSHRFDPIYSHHLNLPRGSGGDLYKAIDEKYVPFLENKIELENLAIQTFAPKAGSVLVWHAALAHGGSKRINFAKTRRSMVSHYFARHAISFADFLGVPCHVHEAWV